MYLVQAEVLNADAYFSNFFFFDVTYNVTAEWPTVPSITITVESA